MVARVLGLSPEPWLVDPATSLLALIHAAALLAMLCLLHYTPMSATVADCDVSGDADVGADVTTGADARTAAYTSRTRACIADGSCTAPLLADAGVRHCVSPLQAPAGASGSGLGYSPPLPPAADSAAAMSAGAASTSAAFAAAPAPATAAAAADSAAAAPPPPGPRRASRKVEPLAAAAASGSAVCGAAVLAAWFALTPCFVSMGLLLVGLAALHACPSWPVWTPPATDAAAAVALRCGMIGPVRGVRWMGGALVMAQLWTVAQYAVAIACLTDTSGSPSWAAPHSPLAMVGLRCTPPLPALLLQPGTTAPLNMSLALAAQLGAAALLAACLRAHLAAVALLSAASVSGGALRTTSSSEVELTALDDDAAAPSATRRLLCVPTPLRTICSRVASPLRSARTVLLEALVWQAAKLPILLVLLAGVSSCDLLHAGWLLLALALGATDARATRRLWPLLRAYTAFAALAQAAYLVASPPTDAADGGIDNGQGHSAFWGELLGLRALPVDPTQLGAAGWDAMGWPLALLLPLAAQAGVYSSATYHRAAAARGWRLAAAAMAPRAYSRRGLKRMAEEWAETLAPWTSYAILLVVVLLPPIGLVGLVTLSLLLSLLYVHQSCVLPESRARLQRPIWLLLAVLMAAAVVMTWAFSVPYIHRALVAPHGLLGPMCDGPAPPNGSGTFCANVLYDLGLAEQADGRATVAEPRAFNLGLAITAALAIVAAAQQRACATKVRRAAPRALGARGAVTVYAPPGPLQMRALRWLDGLATLCVPVAIFVAAVHSENVLGALYLLLVLVGCFGLVRWLWLPAGLLSSAVLVLQYLFQIRLAASWLPAAGCDAAAPPRGCDAIWVGLHRVTSDGFGQTFADLLALLAPTVAIQLLALAMRQFQLRRRRAESAAGATVGSVLEALRQRVSAIRHGAAGSSVAPDAAARDAAARDAEAPDGGGVEPPWYVLTARLLRYPLLGLADPLALLGLMAAAVVRLNLWGLVYVLIAGWLRFGRAGRASWLAARAVLAVAIALQYAAGVSLPPSVWPEPARRPWDTWGADWPPAAATCARLGSNATTTNGQLTSGLVCWAGLGGGLSPWWLSADFAAFGLCTLRCAAAPALAAARAAAPRLDALPRGAPRVLRAAAALECGVLLSAPALALVALFALAALSNLQTAASGLLSGGYLLLTLGLLGRHSGLLRSEGRRWRALHVYAWLVLLLQLLYQAPIVPLASPYSCAASVAKDESTPLSWCTLLMSTLGLFKVPARHRRRLGARLGLRLGSQAGG